MPRFVRLVLAGAVWRDRVLAGAGALVGIALTALVGTAAGPGGLLIAAPMGAAAVLVFAVPASPLAQPWNVVVGNTVSALVGVAAVTLLGRTPLGAGVAVGGAIVAMSMTRSLHPPGGAAALLAVVANADWRFVLFPVALDALVLTGVGLAFHRLSGHGWPHRAPPVAPPHGITADDLDRALADAHEAFDIAPDDLLVLYRRAEQHAASR